MCSAAPSRRPAGGPTPHRWGRLLSGKSVSLSNKDCYIIMFLYCYYYVIVLLLLCCYIVLLLVLVYCNITCVIIMLLYCYITCDCLGGTWSLFHHDCALSHAKNTPQKVRCVVVFFELPYQRTHSGPCEATLFGNRGSVGLSAIRMDC